MPIKYLANTRALPSIFEEFNTYMDLLFMENDNRSIKNDYYNNHNENILDAVIQRDIKKVKALISQNADINEQDKENGFSALHYCAQFRLKDIAKLLIDNNAKIDIKDNDGNTPLFKAVYFSQGDTKIIKMLLAAGANPNSKNKAGVSPRQLAETIASFDVRYCFSEAAIDNFFLNEGVELLNPQTIFKSDKYDIQCNIKIDDNIPLQKGIISFIPKFKQNAKKWINSHYQDWYASETYLNYKNLSKNQVQSMVDSLFDTIEISYNLNNKNEYLVSYWINNYGSHKDSKYFFGSHDLSQEVIFSNNGKIIKINDIEMQG